MTVCQYFLEGRCIFGRNCRNEHSYNEGVRNSRSAGLDSQQLKNIIRKVVGEVVMSEKGGQWPLSCFAPIKEGPNVPGFEDYSPEEIRWKMYDARAKGILNQCINEIKQLYNDAEKKRNALKQPTIENINVISNMIKMRKESAFDLSSSTSNQGSSVFAGSSIHSISPNQSIFGGSIPQATTGTSNKSFGGIFGGVQQSTGSIFGGNSTGFANQNIFGGSGKLENQNQNVFSQSQNQGLFTNTSANMSPSSQNIFSTSQTVSNVNFGNSKADSIFPNRVNAAPIFAAQSMLYQGPSNSNQSIFGGNVGGESQSQNVFSSETPFKENKGFTFDTPKSSYFNNQIQPNFSNHALIVDYSVYSKPENLDPEELQAFSEATFAFGKIPMKPPTLESCK